MAGIVNPYTAYWNTVYPSLRSNPNKYNRTPPIRREMKHAITQLDHSDAVSECTKMVCQIPVLDGVLRRISEWAFAGDSWQPIHYGEDDAWGDLASADLIQNVFPNAIRRTPYKALIKAMQVSCKAWLGQGDDLAILSLDESGNPKMTVIPATCIGNGISGANGWWTTVTDNFSNQVDVSGYGICVGGEFAGQRIYNGIIYGDDNEILAARVLGWKRADVGSKAGVNSFVPASVDIRLGFQYGAHMAFPYDWHGMGRPMPRLASAVPDWKDFQERDDNFNKGIKLASEKTVIGKLPEGMDAQQARGDGAEMIMVTDADGSQRQVLVERLDAGNVTYIGATEELSGLVYANPHPDVEAFAKRKLGEMCFALGWPYEMVDLTSTGRAPTRLACDQANNSIWNLQAVGEERMFWFTKFAIAARMKNGSIPKPMKGNPLTEPYQFTFGYPKEMSVDQGNDVKAQLDMLRYGLTSQRVTSAKWGYVQKQIDRDRDKEVFQLIKRVIVVKKQVEAAKLDIPDQKIMELFWQPAPNSAVMQKETTPDADKAEAGEKTAAAPGGDGGKPKPVQE